jgi:hypothetical protein
MDLSQNWVYRNHPESPENSDVVFFVNGKMGWEHLNVLNRDSFGFSMGFPLIFSTPNGKKTPRGEAGLLRDDAKRAMGGKANATAHGDAIQKTHLTTAWCGGGISGDELDELE